MEENKMQIYIKTKKHFIKWNIKRMMSNLFYVLAFAGTYIVLVYEIFKKLCY